MYNTDRNKFSVENNTASTVYSTPRQSVPLYHLTYSMLYVSHVPQLIQASHPCRRCSVRSSSQSSAQKAGKIRARRSHSDSKNSRKPITHQNNALSRKLQPKFIFVYAFSCWNFLRAKARKLPLIKIARVPEMAPTKQLQQHHTVSTMFQLSTNYEELNVIGTGENRGMWGAMFVCFEILCKISLIFWKCIVTKFFLSY